MTTQVQVCNDSTQVGEDITCLDRLFQRQAEATPDAVALVGSDETVTYRDLNERANQFARYLRRRGVGRGDLVGLFCRRSVNAIVSLLGVLKAGAAYVPLDEAWPDERIGGIVADAGVHRLIVDERLLKRAERTCVPEIIVHDRLETRDSMGKESTDNVDATNGPRGRDLCYIIYTSGTTGRPKGIMTEHRNVVAFAEAFRRTCQMTPDDRVYQGFSLTFDGSVEEIWMAFSSGAELVIGPPEIGQLGEETAKYMRDKKVTFFSTVPTFLAMIEQEVPSLRLVIVSGEACPPSLIDKWVRPGRKMLNVYGPTETTVNTTAWECRPHVPVSIGRPLDGYEVYILDENNQPVSDRGVGELYIGGVGVARGYLGRSELTKKQFVPNPFSANGGVLYRTGDLVQWNENDELMFLGRIDSQVKLRGYRIELAEIESVLRSHPAIEAAAVKVVDRGGLQQLAGFVVPSENGHHPGHDRECEEHVRATSLSAEIRSDILRQLRDRLPAYMVPTLLDELDSLPRLTSGKLDRQRLPAAKKPLVNDSCEFVAPTTELEATLRCVWQRAFEGIVDSRISTDADFFLDLGGYSLLAASVVSLLRGEYDLEVSMREVYQFPTIQQLAEHLEERDDGDTQDNQPAGDREATVSPERRTASQVLEHVGAFQRTACVALQGIFGLLIYGVAAAPLALSGYTGIAMYGGEVSVAAGCALITGLMLGWYPVQILISVAAKWLIIGRYRTGSRPLWGWYFLRFWIVGQFQAASGVGLLAGTPLMSLYYRLMGSKVGRGCILDTPACTAFDLVTIGEQSSVCAQSHLLGYRIEDGMLHFGSTEIGDRCFIGIHCAVGLNTMVQDDAQLGDLSLLPDGATIPQGESWKGSPAQRVTRDTWRLTSTDESETSRFNAFAFGVWHAFVVMGLMFFLYATVAPLAVSQIAIYHTWGLGAALASTPFLTPLFVVWFCVLTAIVKWLVLPRVEPGVYSVRSVFYLRKSFVDGLMAMTRLYMKPVYTTIFLPAWLRLLGAKIGRRAEISTVSQITPDLVEIDDESFFADGSMIGGRHFYRGTVKFGRNCIGRRSFVGNNAILSLGSNLGEQSLLGVLSSPPVEHTTTPNGTEWLGSPSFALPWRRKVEGFSQASTYAPTLGLYVRRILIDSARIIFPFSVMILGGAAFFAYLTFAFSRLPLWAGISLLPFVTLAVSVAMAATVVVLKKLVMGRFKPVIKPLWCTYVWWNEAINGAYESIGAPSLIPLHGTPYFNLFLRAMGCKIGKWSYIGTTLFSEFDLVDIGDYTALNLGVVVQNHLFEDRVMKSSYVHIGNECSVGNHAVVLYDTEVRARTSVGPLSLLMKGEALPAQTDWIGIPTSRHVRTNRDCEEVRQPVIK